MLPAFHDYTEPITQLRSTAEREEKGGVKDLALHQDMNNAVGPSRHVAVYLFRNALH